MEDDKPSKKIKLVDDDELIKRQVEYYFSDVNVVKDKFLLQEFKKDDGWVKLSVLLTFARLKQLTTNVDRIIEAFKDSESEIIELDEEKKQVRRKKPLPDPIEFQKQLDVRTVHISGFPTDYKFDALTRFCSQFGETESVNMRRLFKTREFKGCIHVVFKDESSAKKVLETEILKCKDRELRKESMKDYHRRKEEMAQKRIERRKQKKKEV